MPRRTRLFTTASNSTNFWTGQTRAARYGRTAPISPRRPKLLSNRRAIGDGSIVAARAAARSLSANRPANTTRSRLRSRAEHVFADRENAMGRKIVHTIGIMRARVKIGMINLVYNMRRLIQLDRMAAAPAWSSSRLESVFGGVNCLRGHGENAKNGAD